MPRLRDSQTGSIVNVSEETAKQLGPQYVPVEPEKQKRGRSRKSAQTEE